MVRGEDVQPTQEAKQGEWRGAGSGRGAVEKRGTGTGTGQGK